MPILILETIAIITVLNIRNNRKKAAAAAAAAERPKEAHQKILPHNKNGTNTMATAKAAPTPGWFVSVCDDVMDKVTAGSFCYNTCNGGGAGGGGGSTNDVKYTCATLGQGGCDGDSESHTSSQDDDSDDDVSRRMRTKKKFKKKTGPTVVALNKKCRHRPSNEHRGWEGTQPRDKKTQRSVSSPSAGTTTTKKKSQPLPSPAAARTKNLVRNLIDTCALQPDEEDNATYASTFLSSDLHGLLFVIEGHEEEEGDAIPFDGSSYPESQHEEINSPVYSFRAGFERSSTITSSKDDTTIASRSECGEEEYDCNASRTSTFRTVSSNSSSNSSNCSRLSVNRRNDHHSWTYSEAFTKAAAATTSTRTSRRQQKQNEPEQQREQDDLARELPSFGSSNRGEFRSFGTHRTGGSCSTNSVLYDTDNSSYGTTFLRPTFVNEREQKIEQYVFASGSKKAVVSTVASSSVRADVTPTRKGTSRALQLGKQYATAWTKATSSCERRN